MIDTFTGLGRFIFDAPKEETPLSRGSFLVLGRIN